MATEAIETIEEAILAHVRRLSPERRQQVLDFAEFLAARQAPPGDRKSARGIWADLDIDITEDDIAEVRREMWSDFGSDSVV